jgi:hypothetical protein
MMRRSRLHRALAAITVGMVLLLTSGCGAGSFISNPFASDPTPTPAPPPPSAASSAAQAAPSPGATEAAPAFSPIWVKNHRITEMWSGPTAGPDSISFGMTSQQFCSFQVVLPPNGPRVYVYNPYSDNYFWIDADAIGPVGEPEHRSGPPPAGQNCADAIYSG